MSSDAGATDANGRWTTTTEINTLGSCLPVKASLVPDLAVRCCDLLIRRLASPPAMAAHSPWQDNTTRYQRVPAALPGPSLLPDGAFDTFSPMPLPGTWQGRRAGSGLEDFAHGGL